jgi:CRISPR-associated protein Csx3
VIASEPANELQWAVTHGKTATVATFEMSAELLSPERLGEIGLPAEALQRQHLGLILSGRGPVWLYAYLVHLAHPFAWVATHDPRLGGAVVVQRHRADAPALGSVVALYEGEGRFDC